FRSEIGNVLTVNNSIGKISVEPYAVDEITHVIKRIIPHGIIVLQMAFWGADSKPAEFHRLRMKPHMCVELLYFEARSFFGGYLYVSAESIVYQFDIAELAVDLAKLEMRSVKIIVRSAFCFYIVF